MTIQEIKVELTWIAKEGFINKSAYKAHVTYLLNELKKLEAKAS